MKKLFIFIILSLIGMNGYAKQDVYCPAFVYCPTVVSSGCIVSANWKIVSYDAGAGAPKYMTFINASGWSISFPASSSFCNYSGHLYQQQLTLESTQYDLRPDNQLFGNRWINGNCTAPNNAFDCPFEAI